MTKAPTLGHYVRVMRHYSVRKWKYILKFEIKYLFLEIWSSPKGLTQSQKKVSHFKPHYMLSLSTGWRALLYSACATIQCVRYYTGDFPRYGFLDPLPPLTPSSKITKLNMTRYQIFALEFHLDSSARIV